MNNMLHWHQNAQGDQWLEEVNGHAFKNQSSSSIFSQFYPKTFAKEDHFYVVAGSDSGLLLKYVNTHMQGKRRRFLFIEPDEFYKEIEKKIEKLGLQSASAQIIPLSTFDITKVADEYPEYFQHNRFSIIRSLSVLDKTHPAYHTLWNEVLTQAKLFQFSLANFYSARKFIDTQLYNLPFNLLPVHNIQSALMGKSVLLLGGGPTLDDGIEWIKTHRQHIIIAAVGRIARRLQAEGIEADFYVSVDPNDVSYDNSKWLTLEKNTILIHSNFAHPSLLAEYQSLHCYTDGLFPWETKLNSSNLFCSGPTVTNTMMQILTFLKAQHIYMLGVDFCYGPKGETHESKSLEAEHGNLTHSSDLTVETYSGRKALTNTVFYDAIQAANHYINTVHQQTDTRFYQLGKESARLDSTPLVNFEDIKKNDSKAQEESLSAIRQTLYLSPQEEKNKKSSLLKELINKKTLFNKVLSLAQEGHSLATQLFKDINQLDEQTQKIVHIQKTLNNSEYHWIQEFLYNYAIKNYGKFLSPTEHALEDQTQEDIKQDLQNYFEALKKTTRDFLDTLDKSIEHIQNHLKEYHRDQFATCAAYWLEHQQEGRVRIWCKQHNLSLKKLAPQEQTIAQRLMAAYEEKLKNTENTTLIKRLQNQSETLSYQLTTLDEAVEQQDIYTLQTLIHALEKQHSSRAQSTLALAKGFLAQFNGNDDEALTHFLSVSEKDVLPKALNQVAQIALERGDIASALNALEILAEYDDRYYITYADLFMAAQDPATAIHLYDYYLQNHMDNYVVWLKAAKAAIAGHDTHAAQQCLTQVITHADDEKLVQEAQHLLQNISKQER